MTTPTEKQTLCEYCDCNEIATCVDAETGADLCEKHSNEVYNRTGYCNISCMLGYGCDGSC